jgi:RNA polymerase-binding transcription factor DksA
MAHKKPVSHKAGKPAPKKPAPKKVAKPAPKAAKKPAHKPSPSKSGKAAAKAKPVAKATHKPAPKHVAHKQVKPAAKAAPAKKPIEKHVPKNTNKPEAKPTPPPAPVAKPVVKKPGAFDPKSLVSIKPTAKPIIKKEPPKASKVSIPKTTIKSSVKYEPEFTKSVLDTPMYEHSGPSMRYSDNDLTEFREIINKKLDAAKKELAYLQGLITRRDEGGDMDEARYMTMEDGSVSMEREQLSQMASRQITFIDHLEKATMRIENKTYGVCRVTGKLIDKARLRAVPHATLSIEAKQMMNK